MYIQCIFFSDLTNSPVLFFVKFNLYSLLLLEKDNNIPGYFPLLLKIPIETLGIEILSHIIQRFTNNPVSVCFMLDLVTVVDNGS